MPKKPKVPAMPLYPKDILVDCAHLSDEKFGVYCRLLFYAWVGIPGCRQGELPADDEKIIGILPKTTAKRWAAIRDDVLAFFRRRGKKLTHTRILRELARQEEIRAKRSDAAHVRWQEKQGGRKPARRRRTPAHLQGGGWEQPRSQRTPLQKAQLAAIAVITDLGVEKERWHALDEEIKATKSHSEAWAVVDRVRAEKAAAKKAAAGGGR